jgi:putative nucleotidyltransferase with HDIG domain
LTIARLAESAATAIGANGLLAKVGSYFHDVGKIAKAEYFVENQMGMGNKHDKISPEKSARVIRAHVFDGIELAREYKLPQRIIDFIPMHHGTTPIKYFLDKAREANPDVDESLYRYPGPLPHTRETAIVMLADAVEATTRALPNATKKTIEETVDRVIKKRFSEGQLDSCELTLADLTRIKNAFMKNLVGIVHPRIQYKEGEVAPEPPPPDKRTRREPVIPFVDDAFGASDRPDEG